MTKFSFQLSDSFLEDYKNRQPNWGFTDAGGNSVGELTYIRTYSRVKDDGTKEQWWETCARVVNGMYSIQKDHCLAYKLDWNGHKAQASAREAFDLMFNLKWTPPGRGLAQMGTASVMEQRNVASLLNCAFVSTGDMEREDPGYPFAWTTEALMLGIGVGFDTLGAGKFDVRDPTLPPTTFFIPDSREGWGESIRVLVNSYLKPEQPTIEFDYSLIRPFGSLVTTFGGTASGPEPLEKGHKQIRKVLDENVGSKITSKTITDIQNIIGTFVVAGGTRRSAQLALGLPDDESFTNLKNPSVYPERNAENTGWAYMSNNSVNVKVGGDYSALVENTTINGEPGYIWMDTTRAYGRLIDPPDYKDSKVMGYNPCAEQPLESYEMCCLVTIHLNNIESEEEFKRAIKYAYLYGKTVTLMTTPWPKTNAVMLRNRRIGLSTTGVAGFVDHHSLATYRVYADNGYKYINELDKSYSEWLGIRESIRKTTGKPEGSVSLLSGASPGFHYTPAGEYFIRAIQFGETDTIVAEAEAAGYVVEDSVYASRTKVVYFPVHADVGRAESDVTIFEKIHLAAEGQKYWSDNGISATISFDAKTEADSVATVLSMYEGQLKAISFLPMGNEVYAQQPYTKISEEEYNSYIGKLKPIDFSSLYNNGVDAEGEQYCTTDVCEIPGLQSK